MSERRYKTLKVSAELFLSIMQGFAANDGIFRVPVMDNDDQAIPDDAKVVAVACDHERDLFLLRLEHPSFKPVPACHHVEELMPTFGSYHVAKRMMELFVDDELNRLAGTLRAVASLMELQGRDVAAAELREGADRLSPPTESYHRAVADEYQAAATKDITPESGRWYGDPGFDGSPSFSGGARLDYLTVDGGVELVEGKDYEVVLDPIPVGPTLPANSPFLQAIADGHVVRDAVRDAATKAMAENIDRMILAPLYPCEGLLSPDAETEIVIPVVESTIKFREFL